MILSADRNDFHKQSAPFVLPAPRSLGEVGSLSKHRRVFECEEIKSMLAPMNRNEFLHVTGVEPETFDQLSDGGKIQFLNAVGYAVNQAKDPEDAERLASEAIRSCYEDWQSAMQTVARFIVPPGESDSVASLEHKLSMLKKKVGLVEQPQEAR